MYIYANCCCAVARNTGMHVIYNACSLINIIRLYACLAIFIRLNTKFPARHRLPPPYNFSSGGEHHSKRWSSIRSKYCEFEHVLVRGKKTENKIKPTVSDRNRLENACLVHINPITIRII